MIFLGVDGGGTKTAFALISQQGELLAFTTTGPSHPDQVGMDGVRQTLGTGVREVFSQAGLTLNQLTFSFWGLPGFGENLNHVPQLEAIVRDLVGEGKYRCGNDVEAGWAGSLACQPGVHLVAGTGAIGYGQDPQGKTARGSGWGELFGDEGSAYWLGRKLLELFCKQSDGRLAKSPLYELVRRSLGLTRDLDLMAKTDVFCQRDEMARLAQVAYQAAQAGDSHALNLFVRAAQEHYLTVQAILAQLDFPPGRPVPVSYSGGVFKAGEFILSPLRDRLAALNAALVEPLLTPIMGACLYALKLGGGTVQDELIRCLQEAETRIQ